MQLDDEMSLEVWDKKLGSTAPIFIGSAKCKISDI
jgi:hypothetical protein